MLSLSLSVAISQCFYDLRVQACARAFWQWTQEKQREREKSKREKERKKRLKITRERLSRLCYVFGYVYFIRTAWITIKRASALGIYSSQANESECLWMCVWVCVAYTCYVNGRANVFILATTTRIWILDIKSHSLVCVCVCVCVYTRKIEMKRHGKKSERIEHHHEYSAHKKITSLLISRCYTKQYVLVRWIE